MKVAVYAICLNEQAFAARFVEACREADHIVVADTGSTDGCQEALRAAGATVHEIKVSPWRFDDARNAALALVPQDVDVCLSLDLDEIVRPGWRSILEAGWKPETTRAFYTFVGSHTPDGGDGVTFLNNRMHARHGYRWRHICHEGIYPDRSEETFTWLTDIRVDHWPDETKSRSSYLGLLAAAVAEEPNDARMGHYYGRELYYRRDWAPALEQFLRYLKIGDVELTGERSASMVYAARCLDGLERRDEALQWRYRAVAECPGRREAWVDLAEALYKKQEWPGCYGAARKALSIVQNTGGYMTEPHAWGFSAHDLASIAAWNIGLRNESLDHAERALALAPDDKRLSNNVDLIRAAVQPAAKAGDAVDADATQDSAAP